MKKYRVIRAHWGAIEYKIGDTRIARPQDVAHLIGTRLELIKRKPKKEVMPGE